MNLVGILLANKFNVYQIIFLITLENSHSNEKKFNDEISPKFGVHQKDWGKYLEASSNRKIKRSGVKLKERTKIIAGRAEFSISIV